MPGEYPAYIQFEAEATTISTWHGFIVPGLLQTADYARAIVEAGDPELSSDAVAKRIEARMKRQEVLHKENRSLQLLAVIDEAALRRPTGGHAVMRDQLTHLAEAATWSSVKLQAIPESTGAHAGLSGPFTIMGFRRASAVVYLEHMNGDVFLDDKDDVDKFRVIFERLQRAALSNDESRRLISHVAEQH